jgi:hypothetical protein
MIPFRDSARGRTSFSANKTLHSSFDEEGTVLRGIRHAMFEAHVHGHIVFERPATNSEEDIRISIKPERELNDASATRLVAAIRMSLDEAQHQTVVRHSQIAEYLFYLFLDAKTCDSLVGDLEERYKLILKKFGVRRADFWYWSQALRSFVPIVWVWVKKAAKALTGITAVVEFVRRIRS